MLRSTRWVSATRRPRPRLSEVDVTINVLNLCKSGCLLKGDHSFCIAQEDQQYVVLPYGFFGSALPGKM